MAGISISSNFDLTAQLALDGRYVAGTSTVRDAIVSGVRHPGMQCFVVADQKLYFLKTGITNADWVEVGSGSGGGGAVADNVFVIQDDGDATKQLKFEASTIPTASTVTLTSPAASGTIATLAGAETFSNKTLASPIIDVELHQDQGSTPGTPPSGYRKLYTKADGFLYSLNSAGVESKVGGGDVPNTATVTVKDVNFTIQDDADITKQAKFEASAITTGTTATFTFPIASDTITGIAATQTLTNKTLTRPTVNILNMPWITTPASPTVGTINIYAKNDNELYKQLSGGGETKIGFSNTQTDTFSNKTLDNTNTITVKDTLFTIQDDTDATKLVKFEASGATTATTVTLTVPAASTTIVGTTGTQTLASKTLTSPVINGGNVTMSTAANTNRIVVPTAPTTTLNGLTNTAGSVAYDTTIGKMVYNDSTQWNAIGGRGGFINYAGSVWDGTAPSKYVPYKEAGAVPTAGTGGTTTGITSALNTTLPLSGTQNIRLSKAAGSLIGGGWAFAITVDTAYTSRGVPVNIRLQTRTSANYVAGDVKLYVVDITAATVQAVLTNNADSSVATGTSEFQGQFFPSANATYRLVFHITSTNALAYDLDVAQMVISPQATVPSGGATSWQYWTPVFTGLGTMGGLSLRWRKNGENMEITGYFAVGTPTAVTASMTLPNSLVASPTLTTTTYQVAGRGYAAINNNPTPKNITALYSPSSNLLTFSFERTDAAVNPVQPQTGSSVFLPSSAYFFDVLTIPIASWSSTAPISTTDALMSSGKVMLNRGAQQNLGAVDTKVTWSAGSSDNLAAFDSVNNRYYIKKSGRFLVSAGVEVNVLSGLGIISIWVNGVIKRRAYNNSISTIGTLNIAVPMDLFAGDYIEIWVYSNDTAWELVSAGTASWFTVDQLPDLSVFGTTGRFELLSTTSSPKTPSTSGWYHALTGSSIPLSVGTWRLYGNVVFSDNGGASPAFTNVQAAWFGSNGLDSAANPTSLSGLTGLTILTAGVAGYYGAVQLQSTAFTNFSAAVGEVAVRVTQPVTVYLGTYAAMGTPANSKIVVYANAQREQ